MALGYGYVSSYNGVFLFPPRVTIGIPLVLPVALAIKVFSNQHWVPSVATSFIVLILLLSVMYFPKKIKNITEKQLWIWRLVFMGLMIFASNLRNVDSFILKTGEIARYNGAFSMMLGEFPSALFLVIFAFVLILSENRKMLYFTAGIFASFAFLTKTIALISVLPVFGAYLFFNYSNLKSKMNFITFSAIGFLIPLAGLELYKFIILDGLDNYFILKKQEYSFFREGGSGIYSAVWTPTISKIRSIVYEIGLIRFIVLAVLPFL